ncbi:SDR family NAD(P)-dependent oxidoreductase [Candidatus Bathyarchaeota archaeon]|nr:SDR family NAD(P)-dependent oxidoreductase [Candidatus Bathyarchaeota archaeon]
MRVLVTGGAGFIGSHLVDRLVDIGHEVVALDNFSTGSMRNLSNSLRRSSFQLVRADIRRIPRSFVKRLGKVERVVHLAALTSVPQSVKNPASTIQVNVLGTSNVLQAAKALKAERVVFASSAAVYGAPRVIPISETASLAPISPYGASKAASEPYLRSFEASYGIEGVSLRFFNVYGPRQTSGQYSGVIAVFAKQALNHRPLRIFGDGLQTRDFIYVSDAVDATLAALEKRFKSRVFNIGSGRETTILELAKTIRRIVGIRSAVKLCPPRSGEIIRSLSDVSKASNELGLVSKISLNDGLSRMIRWLADKRRPGTS